MNLNVSWPGRYSRMPMRRLGLLVAVAAAVAMSVVTVSTAGRDASGDAPREAVVAHDTNTVSTSTAPVIVNGGEVVRAPAWGGAGWPGTNWHGGGWRG